ncbi:metalloregulator ArsR/SmtB family transcription factor [Myxococcota bacterium]|nr:metalloregulator ArsR/SmtB family transcription factor [Myxococcota bacterium]
MNSIEAIADPCRRDILSLLLQRERAVGELVDALQLPQPSVSKHLRVLRDVGLVAVRGDAQRRLYRVRVEPLQELDHWLTPFRRTWASRLDALEQHLNTMEEP